jgi:histidinol-phosphate aminotransferase
VAEWPLRLDRLENPYGPSIRVQEAIAAAPELGHTDPINERRLLERIAMLHGVQSDWVFLAAGIDELINTLVLWRRQAGPVVHFPPSDPREQRRSALFGADVAMLDRTHRFQAEIDPEQTWPFEAAATAYVMSPNDPTGTVLNQIDAVRLSRRCGLVVVDERHGEYGARTLLPLVREFDNLIVLQSFENWAGLSAFPFAYAIAPPRLIRELLRHRLRMELPTGTVIAAHATLDDLDYVRATAERVREEKARLFRMLRKLNMLRPLPSWANFLLVRIERGEPVLFEQELADRGIRVHRPLQKELDRHLRISAVGPDSTVALKQALVEIAVDL